MNREFPDISGQEMAEWCELLSDDNEIHLSREAAKAAGFGARRVNPGPANLAYLLACLSAEKECKLTEIDAVFSGNVFEEDTLVATIEDGTARLKRGEEIVLTAHFKMRDGS